MRKIMKKIEAVSPIIATLMLVLVAVGSAGAFYVWQTGWQQDVEGKAGGAGELTAALTIGGSTTVYPFTAVAAELFEAKYTSYKIDFQQGGSGAGVAAVGIGTIDIGSSSARLDSDQKSKYPDLNRDGKKDLGVELVETLVAYDAVVIVVPSATTNTHNLVSINDTTLKAIFYRNGGVSSYSLPTWLNAGTDDIFQWEEIYNTAGSTATNCSGTETIKLYDRAEESGTEETFSKDVIDTGKNNLEDVGISVTHCAGNSEMLTKIAGDKDALGFMSYGYAKAAGSGVRMIPVAEGHLTKTFPGTTDTIGIIDPAKKWNIGGTEYSFDALIKKYVKNFYDGGRELLYITVGEPKGDAKVYIEYTIGPEVNKKICELAGYISLY